jgi:hypothetical protein
MGVTGENSEEDSTKHTKSGSSVIMTVMSEQF